MKWALIFCWLMVVVSAQYNTTYFLDAYNKAYQKVLQANFGGVLSTVPLCLTSEEVEDDTTTRVFNGSSAEYFRWLDERNLSAVSVYFQMQLYQVNEVNEKHQSLTLRMYTYVQWYDCRLRWTEAESSASNFALSPVKFRSMEIFYPPIRLAQEITPQASKETENEVQILKDGMVWLTREYTTTVSCKIDIQMYPFDTQLCNLTFEAVNDKSLVGLPVDFAFYEDIQQGSAYNLRGFMASDTWSVSLLAPTQTPRRYCVNPQEENYDKQICFNDGQNYRLLLRRHPNYQVINLMFPAFLVVIISSCVFLVPPGMGDKMGLSVSILLSMFMFTQLMYENMPETGSTLPLLSQYFLFCVGLVSTSCIYSAVSTVVSGGMRRVPDCLARVVRLFGRFLMSDVLVAANQFHRQAADDSCTEALNGTAHAKNDEELETGRTKMRSSRGASTVVTWSYVAMLMDRLFFFCHILVSACILGTFYSRGYVPWATYAGVHLNEFDWKYICAQRLLQGDTDGHDSEACAQLNYYNKTAAR